MSKPPTTTEDGKLSTTLRVFPDAQPLYADLCVLIAWGVLEGGEDE